MQTIAHNTVAKLAVAFVTVAMLFSFVAPAQAQNVEDMSLEQLVALVNQLLGQTGGGDTASSASVCPYTWTRSLNTGATGADVMALQQFLNSMPETQVAPAGSAGSAGMETQYYGPATAAAVSNFQMKYRAEILSPVGLVNPTGYFGPSTMAKANSLCTSAPVVVPPVTGGGDEDEDEDDDDMDGPVSLSGEASLDSFELDDGDSTIEEGDEDVVIGEITVEFQDGDAEISRLDLALEGDASGDEPWEAFDTVSLWVDGDKVAEFDASDEDEYLDEDTGEMRFTGLDIVAMEDDELEISIAVSVQNNLDAAELGDWTLSAESMRFFDADGVATTEDGSIITSDSVTFEVQEAGTDEELDVSLSSSNPDSDDIVVDTDNDTNDVTILVADLEAEDNDLELNTVIVKISVDGATTTSVTDVVDDIRVVIDGESFDAEAIGTEDDYDAAADDDTPSTATGISEGYSELAHATNSVWYLFDIDGDIVIDEDDTVEMEVVVDFNDTNDGARYANGTMIDASIASTELNEWEVEGDEDLANSQFSGSAVGDEHTLVAEGILLPRDGVSPSTDTSGDNDTLGEFTIEFDVTAIEGDFYITDNADLASSSPTNGVEFTLDGPAAGVVDAVVNATLSSTGDEDTAGVFTVREGQTETFTLLVTVDPDTSGNYRVTLNSVFYSASSNGTTNAVEYTATPSQDFRTAYETIQAS